MNDSHLILGLSFDADKKAIQTAYRALAKTHHPDQDTGNEEKFRQIKLAYETLIAGNFTSEKEPHQPTVCKNKNQNNNNSPKNINVTLTIELGDIVKGAKRRLTLPNGQELEVCIPKGHNPENNLRLSGQAINGGDVIIKILVRSDPSIHLQGRNLLMYLEIPLWELRKGSEHKVILFGQKLQFTIPALSSPGKTLLLKGKGLAANKHFPAGDLLLTLTAKPSAEMQKILEQFSRAFIHSAELRQQHLRTRHRSALITK